jgi:hypothetical protein
LEVELGNGSRHYELEKVLLEDLLEKVLLEELFLLLEHLLLVFRRRLHNLLDQQMLWVLGIYLGQKHHYMGYNIQCLHKIQDVQDQKWLW